MHLTSPKKPSRLHIVPLVLFLLVAGIVFIGWKNITNTPASGTPEPKPAAGFDKQAHSLTDPASPWVIVNKQRPLQSMTYKPAGLVTPAVPLRLEAGNEEMLVRRDAAQALEKLVGAATKDGLSLMLASGYRSYDSQKQLYDYYVWQQGKASADSQSARPGYSEHQTGLGVDLGPVSRTCEVQSCFADTPEGKWLAANAHAHGFIIRYPEGQETTTGYIYEPWHLRYVGTALAAELHASKTPTLEDFFTLKKAADY